MCAFLFGSWFEQNKLKKKRDNFQIISDIWIWTKPDSKKLFFVLSGLKKHIVAYKNLFLYTFICIVRDAY